MLLTAILFQGRGTITFYDHVNIKVQQDLALALILIVLEVFEIQGKSAIFGLP
jgi:hypothetical protein